MAPAMPAERNALLEQAILAADLSTLIAEKFPDCMAHRGAYQHATKAMFVAVWRNEKSPSVSLTLKSGRWLWHDHGTHEGGNAFTFLTLVCGLAPAQAARELLERVKLNTSRTGLSPVENERGRQIREFARQHPKADAGFFEDWVELRGAGWREIGTPVSRFALEFVATTPALPDLPEALTAYKVLGQSVPLEGAPFGAGNLEALAFWIADAFAPAFAPTKNSTAKNVVQHATSFAPPSSPLGVGAMVQSFDPLTKYQRKIDRLTRGIR